MVSNHDYDYFSFLVVVVVKMSSMIIMQSIDYSRLFWLFFGILSHVYHEEKSWIED